MSGITETSINHISGGMGRNSFVFFSEWMEIIKDYPDKVRLAVYDAIFTYIMTGEEPEIGNEIARSSFAFIRQGIDADNARREMIREKRSAAGKLGGAPKGNTNAAKVGNSENPSGNKNKQKQAKQAKTSKNKQNKQMLVSGNDFSSNEKNVMPVKINELGTLNSPEIDVKKIPNFCPNSLDFDMIEENKEDKEDIEEKEELEEKEKVRQKEKEVIEEKEELEEKEERKEGHVDFSLFGEIQNESRPKIPFPVIAAKWNDFATRVGLSRIQTMTEARKGKFLRRMNEMHVTAEHMLDKMDDILAKIELSGFLLGDNKRGWKASFDFVFESERNMVRIMEGAYGQRKPKPASPYERIEEGKRVYGERNIVIPNDAPPRPYSDSIWDKARRMWITE